MWNGALSSSPDLSGGVGELTPEQLGDAILRGTVFMVVVFNHQGIVTFFNAAAERGLGYNAVEIVGRQSPMLWHDIDEVSQYAAELSAELGEPIEPGFDVLVTRPDLSGLEAREWSFIRKDGSRFPGLLSIDAMRDEVGQTIGYLGIIEDISRRKMQERILQNRDLFLNNLIDTIADGLITINQQGVVHSFNPACEALFGYQAEQIIGRSISILMPEAQRDKYDAYLAAYLATPGDKKIVGREVKGRRRDGSVVPLEISISRFEADGRAMFSAVMRDVSDRNRVKEEREQLIEKLIESNAEFERFAYVASHDMQEPLRTMTSFSDLVLGQYRELLDENGRTYLQLIYDAATRMQAMVVDLLEYARAGRETSRSEIFDAYSEYSHVLQNLSTSIERSDVHITSAALPSIKGNPVQFSRLLQNLIGNALKYRRADTAPVIHVRAEDQDDMWLFSVIDNGIGIHAKDLNKIFEPFKRLHTRQQYSGTGLGLSVCRKIVENHGGHIWCTSEPGQGSTFHFTWPK